MKSQSELLIKNSDWTVGPNVGFLTPTGLISKDSDFTSMIFGGVRDFYGRACVRAAIIDESGRLKTTENVCFDRRGSSEFDGDGTILGHVYTSGDLIRMIYIGFQRAQNVKFRALTGLAESRDGGKTFHFRKQILRDLPKSVFGPVCDDIVACHWADLDKEGNGYALIAVGSGWVNSMGQSFPCYSSYFVRLEEYEFSQMICKFPQSHELYRLGRPRFLLGFEYEIAVLTGGKLDGDYRPYFFQLHGDNFIIRDDLHFPIEPGMDPNCKIQVSYPEVVKFPSNRLIFVFNGDNMGKDGCLSVPFAV